MRKIDVLISVAIERSSIISRIRVDMIHARHFIIAKEAKMYLSISNIKDLFLFHIKFCFKSNLILMKHESLHFFRKKIKKLSDEEIYYILYFVGINKNWKFIWSLTLYLIEIRQYIYFSIFFLIKTFSIYQ